VHRSYTELPLVAGGKPFGGGMTSEMQAAEPLAGVSGSHSLTFRFIRPASRRPVARIISNT
jgi:hypothetical protein